MNCDYLDQSGICSPACKKYRVPCSLKPYISDSMITIVVLVVMVLAVLA